MYTDTHCHILSSEYNNIDSILKNLKINNIKRIIINGYNYQSNIEVIKLVNKYKNVYGALGIHPNNIEDFNDKTINHIINNINHPKIIAIGEIGLDYYRNNNNKNNQKSLLISLLNIAKNYNKPVIIHNRQSTDDLLKILKEYKIKGIIHSFSGSYETAIEFIKLGFKLGINGIITFKNSKLNEVLNKIPINNILLETDSPYITPEPYRGKQNEPKYIVYIAKKFSKIYNLSEKDLSFYLEKNFYSLFDIEY
ncbi:MAG: TatD family hydrolase [Bacilli bacterium]|nr:TatD family hydrolase [Bacilli bacterium]MDD4406588.1 TatD family hydrolase [Bacilli bacterium]